MSTYQDWTREAAAVGDHRRIVVVGPCASGKSSLAAALQQLGYDAVVSGQEHSEIASLWARAAPDIVIVLTADIASVRARRGESWPEWLHDVQMGRLEQAMLNADLVIDTSLLDAFAVLSQATAYLAQPHPEK